MSKQYCPQGHDTWVTGRRSSNNQCTLCSKEGKRKYMVAYRQGQLKGPVPRLDAAPLLEILSRRPIRTYDEPMQRRFYRIKAKGDVTVYAADEIACALGMHPIEIWGDEWLT